MEIIELILVQFFGELVLGCIDADFFDKEFIVKHFRYLQDLLTFHSISLHLNCYFLQFNFEISVVF